MLDQCIMLDHNIVILEKFRNSYCVTEPTTKARFFYIGKFIINSTLPNQGNVYGYALSDNILKFSYNYCLRIKRISESNFILRHNFKIFNYDINLNKENSNMNRLLIQQDKDYVEAKKNQNNSNKSITLEVKDNRSNESFKTITKYEKIQEDVDKKDNLKKDSRPHPKNLISKPTNIYSSIITPASSSSSNMIDKNEKIVNFYDIQIKVQNNIITEVNGTSFIKPIMTDENLKFYFKRGHNKNIFLNNFYYDLHKKNYYKIYTSSFFLLSENFKEEFKILITFFNVKEFTLNENIINWFIQNKIENERNLLLQEMKNLNISNKNERFLSSSKEEYYDDYNIDYRKRELYCDLEEDLSIFYESIDKYKLLLELKEALKPYIILKYKK